MNTKEIRLLATTHHQTNKIFNGVFAADELPRKKKEGIYIVNLDESHKPGSHWVAIEIVSKKGEPHFYFDSYGLPPKKMSVKKILRPKYTFNRKRLQHVLSTACGQWCLYFLLRRSQGWTPLKIFEPFKIKNSLVNDHVISYLVEKNYKSKSWKKVIDINFLKKQLCIQDCKPMKVNLLEEEINYGSDTR